MAKKTAVRRSIPNDNEIVTRGILKEELRDFSTKQEIQTWKQEMPSKQDLETWRQEIQAWRQEIPTRHDLAVWKDEIITAVKRERHEFEALEGEHQEYEIGLENRITAVERDVEKLKRAR